MKTNKSSRCLENSYTAFLSGDTDLARRSLNITFNHVSNNDWSPTDVQRILCTLSWLYFSEGRFGMVAAQLEQALLHSRRSILADKKDLAYLYYNLAECYRRVDKNDQCRISFLTALDLLEASVGIGHRAFILVNERYLEVCVRPTCKIEAAEELDEDYDDYENQAYEGERLIS